MLNWSCCAIIESRISNKGTQCRGEEKEDVGVVKDQEGEDACTTALRHGFTYHCCAETSGASETVAARSKAVKDTPGIIADELECARYEIVFGESVHGDGAEATNSRLTR